MIVFRRIKSYTEHVDECCYHRKLTSTDCLDIANKLNLFKHQEIQDLREYVAQLENHIRGLTTIYSEYPNPPFIGVYELNEAEPKGKLVR